MNHTSAYERLILSARGRKLVGYSERHHILPRALGGKDDASNLVRLTAREHFVAHALLAHIHGGVMWLALLRMKRGCGSARLYEIARRKAAEFHPMKDACRRAKASQRQKENNSMSSIAARRKSSKSHKGKPSPRKGVKLSIKAKELMSKRMKGTARTKGKTWSVNSLGKDRMSVAAATTWATRLGRDFSPLQNQS
jgi:hypothetical protein